MTKGNKMSDNETKDPAGGELDGNDFSMKECQVGQLIRTLQNAVAALHYVRTGLPETSIESQVLGKLERDIKETLIPAWLPTPYETAKHYLNPVPGIKFEFGMHEADDNAYLNMDISGVTDPKDYVRLESLLVDAANSIAHELNRNESNFEYEEGSWAASDYVTWYDKDGEEVESVADLENIEDAATAQVSIMRV
jgi:hypothetical protein